MKVLVVTHDSNFSGGANRSLFTNIKILKDEYKVNVTVLLPSSSGQLNKKLDEIGVKWFSTRYFGVMSGLRHDGRDILRYFKVYVGYYLELIKGKMVANKIRNQNYDLVYTNTRLPMIGAVIAKELGIPHITHVREFGTVEPLWGKWGFKEIYDNNAKIILISDALKSEFEKHVPADKLIVSHNGIDYPNAEYRYNKISEKKTIHLLLTGRLVPDKGHKDAIYALEKIKKERLLDKQLILHIAGSSPKRTHIEWYEKEIRQLVVDLGLEDCVVFEGEVSDINNLRKKMDIELMCAICETFGRVTVEAMRSNLLVIGSNTGGTLEIITDGFNGYLYQQGNGEDLAHKIVRSLQNESEFNKITRNAWDYSKNNYTTDINCADIYKVMRECLNNEKI